MPDSMKKRGPKPGSLAREKSTNFVMPTLDPGTIPVLTDVESRVDYVVSLMREFKWVRGKTAKTLAKAWGVAQATIEGYSAEAHRVVTANRDEAQRTISLVAYELMIKAAKSGNAKDAAAIGKLWADVSGANAPTQQEIMVDAGSLNPAKARELTKQLFSGGVGNADKDKDSDVNESVPETVPTPGTLFADSDSDE